MIRVLDYTTMRSIKTVHHIEFLVHYMTLYTHLNVTMTTGMLTLVGLTALLPAAAGAGLLVFRSLVGNVRGTIGLGGTGLPLGADGLGAEAAFGDGAALGGGAVLGGGAALGGGATLGDGAALGTAALGGAALGGSDALGVVAVFGAVAAAGGFCAGDDLGAGDVLGAGEALGVCILGGVCTLGGVAVGLVGVVALGGSCCLGADNRSIVFWISAWLRRAFTSALLDLLLDTGEMDPARERHPTALNHRHFVK